MSNKNYSKERFCCGISIQVDRWPATCINFWAADILTNLNFITLPKVLDLESKYLAPRSKQLLLTVEKINVLQKTGIYLPTLWTSSGYDDGFYSGQMVMVMGLLFAGLVW